MDERLQTTIDKIVRLSGQNSEFDKELRKRLGVVSCPTLDGIDGNKVDEIYEYCIEKVVKQQATEFYADFPIPTIIGGLVSDFCRMEFFRRKDCFVDFCLSLYQQIECIVNKLCVNPDLNDIVERMWWYPAYIKSGKNITPSIENRSDGEYAIASLVFPGTNKRTGLTYASEKTQVTLQSQYALDKIRIVTYFLCYKAKMSNGDYTGFLEITNLLSDVYLCRNMNHRGNELTKKEKEVFDKIMPHKSVYYLKFLGALTQFVEQVKEGWKDLPSIKSYALLLPPKKVSPNGIKVVGKIELPEDNRKRFK